MLLSLMTHELLTTASARSNVDLVARLQSLAARAREDTAEMVAHLAELEKRRIHLAEGYGSLFTYCTTVYGRPSTRPTTVPLRRR